MAKTKNSWTDALLWGAVRFLCSTRSAPFHQVRDHLDKHMGNHIPPNKRGHYPSNPREQKWAIDLLAAVRSFVDAGFLIREGRVWSITPLGIAEMEGQGASVARKPHDASVNKHKPEAETTGRMEASVKQASDNQSPEGGRDDNDGDIPAVQMAKERNKAIFRIERYIKSMDPFAFQELVAALLRGMGYYVREVSPRNTADGGIDIVAYQGGDVLGAKTPRIKAQVKRQQNTTGEPELRELLGVMTDGDIGVFISTGGFARGCPKFAKQQPRQLELIHMSRFIELWRDNYGKLSDEDKSLLPLQPIYFLDEERVKHS
ncbi:MAG: restriction endonuclease [Gammaproteobacteria bacterium]